MDSFKNVEVERMRLGGNKPWRDFFNSHQSNKIGGRTFEDSTISERYDSDAGEEWKERLTAKVEGREYVPVPKEQKKEVDRGRTGVTPVASGRNTPIPGSAANANAMRSPPLNAQGLASPSQKTRNEAYFSRMGEANASRPDGVAPSQGGKYGGFGSAPPPPATSNNMPTSDGFQRDPMAALTKGFGWLSSTVSKQAATVNQSIIQPGMKSIADGEFAAQARATAMQTGSYIQQGAKGVGDSFNKFVDPDQSTSGPIGGARGAPEKKDFWDGFGQPPGGPPKEKKSFWDDFAAAGEAATQNKAPKPTGIGTSAMKTNASGSGRKEEGDGWGEW